MMRTTVSLPDDVLESARVLALHDRVSLGSALAILVRRGLSAGNSEVNKSGFPCFPVAKSAKPITLEQTLEAEDDL